MDSILNSIKKMLGIEPDYEHFDQELVMHINSFFMIVHQLGVGPQKKPFRIKGKDETWDDFSVNVDLVEAVKDYLYIRVRLVFDPPANSFVVTEFVNTYKELEWRMNVQVDPEYLEGTEGGGGTTPVSVPNLISPSVTLSEPGPFLMETGSTRGATITVVFNRGYIDPAYGTSGKRSGEAVLYSLNGVDQATPEFDVTIDELNASFFATVSYEEGEQPKDSAGENYDKPLSAGNVTSPALVYEFVDPIWSNARDNTVIEKEPLMSRSVGVIEFTFAPQTATSPERFDIPAAWNVTAIEVFNEITEKYQDNAVEFDVSNTVHQNAAGVDVAYKRYSDNRGYKAGERKIRVKWT